MNTYENKSLSLEERVARLEKIVLRGDYSAKKDGNIEKLLVENVEKISTQNLVVLVLKLKPKQTKIEMKKMMEDFGKIVGNWFRGGNINNRLIKKSLIKKDGKNDKNENLFSLTKKGERLAEELIEKIKSKI